MIYWLFFLSLLLSEQFVCFMCLLWFFFCIFLVENSENKGDIVDLDDSDEENDAALHFVRGVTYHRESKKPRNSKKSKSAEDVPVAEITES